MGIETMWQNMALAWANIVGGLAQVWEWLITPRQILGQNFAPIYILGGATLAFVAGAIIIKEAIS